MGRAIDELLQVSGLVRCSMMQPSGEDSCLELPAVGVSWVVGLCVNPQVGGIREAGCAK